MINLLMHSAIGTQYIPSLKGLTFNDQNILPLFYPYGISSPVKVNDYGVFKNHGGGQLPHSDFFNDQ